ncbi:unnamed protein product [Dicrocoelium dendriticum]|nr:unnamed protein product [Dicrocoelium dendriticum]
MHLRRDVCLLGIVPPCNVHIGNESLLSFCDETSPGRIIQSRPPGGGFPPARNRSASIASEQFKADLQNVIADVPLYNHVITSMRFRTGDTPSVLDLMLSNEELMVDTVTTD